MSVETSGAVDMDRPYSVSVMANPGISGHQLVSPLLPGVKVVEAAADDRDGKTDDKNSKDGAYTTDKFSHSSDRVDIAITNLEETC